MKLKNLLGMSRGKEKTDYKQTIKNWNEQLDQQFATVGIDDLIKMRSGLVDGLLNELWKNHNLDDTDLSLNAVGGYGREELHLHSDIDISIIAKHKFSEDEKKRLEGFLTELWDIGLEVGHSVRTLKEMKREIKGDVITATNMLDIRTITGEKDHAQTVLDNLYKNGLWSSKKFWIAKFNEQQDRYKKLDNENFSMQPNLKNSPGGLRDIQTVIWVARKHFSVNNPEALKTLGYYTSEEYSELLECQYFIWRVRWALHKVTGRAENQLFFEHQAEVANLMGFGTTGNIAIEKMMRQLFRAMKRVRELNQMLALFLNRDLKVNIQKKRRVINDNFEVHGSLIHARNENVFIERKQIISMFVHMAEEGDKITGITAETLRLLRQVRRRILGDLQDFSECRKEFIKLFSLKDGLGNALRFMHRHGILSVYFPQWREIVGQMQFDLYHAYTVDEHTFRVLHNLHSFENEKQVKSVSLAADLYKSLENKLPLRIAAMFHDIAKGRGGDHSILGAMDVGQFAEFHGLRKSDVNLIKWLVENHLLLSLTAQQQDIFDPEVILEFAKNVGSQRKLDMLYSLTVADINATNDNLWNDWKASLIGQLYQATKKTLRDGLENLNEYKNIVKENKGEAQVILENSDNFDQVKNQELQRLWRKIPISFFGRYEPAEIARYSLNILNSPDETIITVDEKVVNGCNEVFVYIKDRKGLFVSLFKTFANLNVSTHDAQISVTKDGYVIETLKILDFDNEPITDRFRLQELEQKLYEVLVEKKEIAIPRKPHHLKAFDSATNVEFLKSRKKDRTLLSISALNNPQLMEKICQVFQMLKLRIHTAKINTIGETADNVFMLSNKDNHSLTAYEKQKLGKLLLEKLG